MVSSSPIFNGSAGGFFGRLALTEVRSRSRSQERSEQNWACLGSHLFLLSAPPRIVNEDGPLEKFSVQKFEPAGSKVEQAWLASVRGSELS
jgi:hypothetical protein